MKCKSVGLVVLILGVLLLSGCNQQPASVSTTAAIEAPAYTGVLRADYADALDVTSQLALGVLRLEGTADAITAEQAAQALPLWKTVQGGTLKTQAEQLALTKQIESALTAAQVAAIAAMQLTDADAQTWLQEQGPAVRAQGGQIPGGGMNASGQGNVPAMSDADREAMRQRFENMTDEERAQMQAQFGQGGGRPGGGGSAPTGGFDGAAPGVSGMLTRAVVTLLTERSGQVGAANPPAIVETSSVDAPVVATTTIAPDPTATPTPVTRITLVPWRTPEQQATPTPAASATQAARTSTSAPASTTALPPSVPPIGGEDGGGALVQKPDTDPGPPLTIEITTNTAEPNPLLEGGVVYRVGGYVLNPNAETYQVTAVHVTFFRANGSRYGAMEAQISCAVLGSGESCPFVAELAGQPMSAFLVHPDAKVAKWHEPVGVALSDTKIADTGTNYVRISGAATNSNAYAIKNVVISALLLDAGGQTVSMGTGVVTYLEAGASARFEVYVAKKAYATYQLHARAEQSVN